MMRFERKQKIFDVGGVKMGGQPGRLPTVLIGSIFYEGDRIVENEKIGVFDERKAEELINKQQELSDMTGNPSMIDIVAESADTMKKYIDFVCSISNAPILLDSTSAETKVSGLKHANEVGLIEKVVYNSISIYTKDFEIDAMREVRLESAIVQTYHPKNPKPEAKIDLLKGRKNVLKNILEKSRIKNILVDASVIDVPSIGIAAETVRLVKKEFGFPAGGGPTNAILTWKKVKNFGYLTKKICIVTSITPLLYAGADFILYGPIKMCEIVFPCCAMLDAIIAYSARIDGFDTETKDHPLYKIF